MTVSSEHQASFDHIRRAPTFASTDAWTALAMAAAGKQGTGAIYHARAMGRLIQLFLSESKESSEDAFPQAMIFAITHAMNIGYGEASRDTALDLLEGGWVHGKLLHQWRNS